MIAEQAAGVTFATRAWTIGTVVQRESMRTVVRRWLPSGCIVARGAVDAEQTDVERRLSMASNTVARCTLENAPGMALATRNLDMGAGKGESGLVVVKGNLFPSLWGMALPAKRPILAVVGISLLMAGKAIYWHASKAPLRMAIDTIHPLVPAHELEGKPVMIDQNLRPILRCVAPVAAHPQNTLMNVGGLVTSITFPVCSGKDAIDVAPPAGSSSVPAFQQKADLIVIEGSLRPAFRCVTFAAILPEPSFVGIVSLVASEAVSADSPQI